MVASVPNVRSQRSVAAARGRDVALIRRLQDDVYARVVRAAGLSGTDLVLVAISGGPDSTVLLDTLLNVGTRGGPRIHLAHFDHGLRPDSARVAATLGERARALSIPATIERAEPSLAARPPGVSLEMAARDARWAFLRRAARDVGAARILTGHTRDDQVETVLMNLARGAGARGLGGMRPDGETILRPLLDVSRQTVMRYLAARGLEFDRDPTNASPCFRRNRVRAKLVPLLEDIFPGSAAAVARAAKLTGREPGVTLVAVPRGLRMPVHPLRLGVPPGPLPVVLTAALRHAAPGAPPLGAAHIGAVDAALAGRAHGRWVQLPGAIWAFVREGAVVLYPERVVESSCASPLPLLVPGVVELPGASIYAQRVDPVETGPTSRRADTAVVAVPGGQTHALTVRTPRPGDRFQRSGAGRPQEILRFLKQCGLPASLRPGTPVVEIDGDIAWLAGVAIAHRFRSAGGAATRVRLDVRWDDVPMAE